MEPPPDEPPRVYPPLSRWRRKLAELHFRGGLVHAVVSRKFKTLYRGRHGQDLIQVAAVALCEAAQRYDPTYRTRDGKRVKFVTYAWRCVFGQVCAHLTRRVTRAERNEVRLVVKDVEEQTQAVAKWLREGGTYREVEAAADARHLTRRLSLREAEILLDRMSGETLEEISHKHGVSKERVRQIEAKGMGKLREAAGV